MKQRQQQKDKGGRESCSSPSYKLPIMIEKLHVCFSWRGRVVEAASSPSIGQDGDVLSTGNVDSNLYHLFLNVAYPSICSAAEAVTNG